MGNAELLRSRDVQDQFVKELNKSESEIGSELSYFGDKSGADDQQLGMSADKENSRYADRGLLDKETGRWIGRTSKGKSITMGNLRPSKRYIDNFDAIRWDTPPERRMT